MLQHTHTQLSLVHGGHGETQHNSGTEKTTLHTWTNKKTHEQTLNFIHIQNTASQIHIKHATTSRTPQRKNKDPQLSLTLFRITLRPMPLERHLCRFRTKTNLVAQILTTQNWDRSISYVTQVYVSLPPTSGTHPCAVQRNVAQNLRFEMESVSLGADCVWMAMLDIAENSNLHNLCACENLIGVPQQHKNNQTPEKC